MLRVGKGILLSFLEDYRKDEAPDLTGPRERIHHLEAFGSG